MRSALFALILAGAVFADDLTTTTAAATVQPEGTTGAAESTGATRCHRHHKGEHHKDHKAGKFSHIHKAIYDAVFESHLVERIAEKFEQAAKRFHAKPEKKEGDEKKVAPQAAFVKKAHHEGEEHHDRKKFDKPAHAKKTTTAALEQAATETVKAEVVAEEASTAAPAPVAAAAVATA